MLKVTSLKAANYILEVPYYIKKPNDWHIKHSRNSIIKDQLFYDLIKGNELEQVCLRVDHEKVKYKACKIRGQVKNYKS